MVVLDEFSQMAKDDDGNNVETEGFVFSSKALLDRIDLLAKSQPSGVSLMADGTYKLLHNGWVLCILGGHEVNFATGGTKIVYIL